MGVERDTSDGTRQQIALCAWITTGHDQIVAAIHPFAHYDVIGTIVSGPLRLWTLELAPSPAEPHS
jgi:hypothetical protein